MLPLVWCPRNKTKNKYLNLSKTNGEDKHADSKIDVDCVASLFGGGAA